MKKCCRGKHCETNVGSSSSKFKNRFLRLIVIRERYKMELTFKCIFQKFEEGYVSNFMSQTRSPCIPTSPVITKDL